jgi:hypothetical protein
MKPFYLFSSLLILCSACSILVGQVKPVEEKADRNLSVRTGMDASGWKRLKIPSESGNNSDTPDEAWQSGTTPSVISLNSVCRKKQREGRDIREIADNLISQFDDLRILSRKSTPFKKLPSVETIAIGSYLGQERKIKSVVVQSPACIYDLIYLSPVETFDQEVSVFDGFRDNLNIK